MVGFRYLKTVVDRYQTPNTSLAIKHYEDLQYCSMVLHNEITRKLHNTHKGNRTFVDIVLGVSKVVCDATTLRPFIKEDEGMYMTDMVDFYYGHDMQYRIPGICKTVRMFRDRRANKAKDCAIEIVAKMYEIHCRGCLSEEEVLVIDNERLGLRGRR